MNSVLDALEDASKSQEATRAALDNELQHVLAVQIALGGNRESLLQLRRFVNCSVQIERALLDQTRMTWLETPCSCTFVVADDCPHTKLTQGYLGRRNTGHE